MVYTNRSFISEERGKHHGSIDNSITYASVVKGKKTPSKKRSATFVDNNVRTEFPSLGFVTRDLGDWFTLVITCSDAMDYPTASIANAIKENNFFIVFCYHKSKIKPKS